MQACKITSKPSTGTKAIGSQKTMKCRASQEEFDEEDRRPQTEGEVFRNAR
jgi:hypothetical protein